MAAEEALSSAEAAVGRGDFAAAERALTAEWPTQAQMTGDALHVLASVRFGEGKIDQAAQLLKSAVALEPDALRHRIALGHTLTNLEDHAGAAAAFGEAMRINMKWPGLIQAYAMACYNAGNFKEAELAAREMLKADPSPQAYDTLSCALRGQGKAQEALAAADEAARRAPENPAIQHTRAAALLQLGRAQEALDILDNLQARGVQAPVIWLNKGKALASLKRQSDAVAAFTEGARRWPKHKDLQKALAEARP
ncbi:MAG: tetratricopeptide repeat protein [Terricaulis sp.]